MVEKESQKSLKQANNEGKLNTIRLTEHAIEQAKLRGTNFNEIELSILKGQAEPVKKGRTMHRYNFQLFLG